MYCMRTTNVTTYYYLHSCTNNGKYLSDLPETILL